jgi:hypothetical protein
MDNSEENIIIEMNPTTTTERTFNCECGKQYSDRSGLRKHKLKCRFVNFNEIIEDKDDEISNLKNKLVQFDARIKKLAEKNDELTRQLADVTRDSAVQLEAKCFIIETLTGLLNKNQPIIGTPVPIAPLKKKLTPEEHLKQNCQNALDAVEFMKGLEFEDADFDMDTVRNTTQWFVNIIDRNLKNAITDVNRRPFHFIRDSNTNKTIMIMKNADGWTTDPKKVENLMTSGRRRANIHLHGMIHAEKARQLEYDKQNYYPEKDEDGVLIEKDWERHKPNSNYIEILEVGINGLVKGLVTDSQEKEVLRLMREKYPLKDV